MEASLAGAHGARRSPRAPAARRAKPVGRRGLQRRPGEPPVARAVEAVRRVAGKHGAVPRDSEGLDRGLRRVRGGGSSTVGAVRRGRRARHLRSRPAIVRPYGGRGGRPAARGQCLLPRVCTGSAVICPAASPRLRRELSRAAHDRGRATRPAGPWRMRWSRRSPSVLTCSRFSSWPRTCSPRWRLERRDVPSSPKRSARWGPSP